MQIVTGNGGAPPYEVNPNEDNNAYMVEKHTSQRGYTECTVSGDKMVIRHVLADGTVFDSLTVHANSKSGVKLDKKGALIEPRGRTLVEEKVESLKNWRHEGGGRMVLDAEEKNTLRLECVGSAQGQEGAQAFFLDDFPDSIAIEFDMKMLTKNGLLITFFAMKGIDGGDMFNPTMPKRAGVFSDYVRNPLLRSYHVSISRYDDDGKHTGVSNWRRNPGLNLMGQGPDPCEEINRWYRIRIVKAGLHYQRGVNGVLAHEFTDPGTLETPIPDSGKIGLRAIGSEVRVLIRNFSVTALR